MAKKKNKSQQIAPTVPQVLGPSDWNDDHLDFIDTFIFANPQEMVDVLGPGGYRIPLIVEKIYGHDIQRADIDITQNADQHRVTLRSAADTTALAIIRETLHSACEQCSRQGSIGDQQILQLTETACRKHRARPLGDPEPAGTLLALRGRGKELLGTRDTLIDMLAQRAEVRPWRHGDFLIIPANAPARAVTIITGTVQQLHIQLDRNQPINHAAALEQATLMADSGLNHAQLRARDAQLTTQTLYDNPGSNLVRRIVSEQSIDTGFVPRLHVHLCQDLHDILGQGLGGLRRVCKENRIQFDDGHDPVGAPLFTFRHHDNNMLLMLQRLFVDMENILHRENLPTAADKKLAITDQLKKAADDLTRTVAPRNKLARFGFANVIPLTENQRGYVHALNTHDLVLVEGPAGSGKTLLAVHHALQLLARGTVDKIILAKPMMASIGTLPGNANDKMWNQYGSLLEPIAELLCRQGSISEGDARARLRGMINDPKSNPDPKEAPIFLKAIGDVQGESFKRAAIILDEAQNATPDEIKMFIQRLGTGAFMTVCGSLAQQLTGRFDYYRTQQMVRPPSGFAHVLEQHQRAMTQGQPPAGIAVIRLEPMDVKRHPTVRAFQEMMQLQEKPQAYTPPHAIRTPTRGNGYAPCGHGQDSIGNIGPG